VSERDMYRDEKTKEMFCHCLKAANRCIDLNDEGEADDWEVTGVGRINITRSRYTRRFKKRIAVSRNKAKRLSL